jgi:hypothetical protein
MGAEPRNMLGETPRRASTKCGRRTAPRGMDPIGLGGNLYGFRHGNPVNYLLTPSPCTGEELPAGIIRANTRKLGAGGGVLIAAARAPGTGGRVSRAVSRTVTTTTTTAKSHGASRRRRSSSGRRVGSRRPRSMTTRSRTTRVASCSSCVARRTRSLWPTAASARSPIRCGETRSCPSRPTSTSAKSGTHARSAAEYVSRASACFIDAEYVDTRSPEVLASAIAHEATHARLSRAGISNRPLLRPRVERRCVLEEVSFLSRIEGSEPLIASLIKRLDEPWWSDEQLFQRRVEQLTRLGVPIWALRVYEYLFAPG